MRQARKRSDKSAQFFAVAYVLSEEGETIPVATGRGSTLHAAKETARLFSLCGAADEHRNERGHDILIEQATAAYARGFWREPADLLRNRAGVVASYAEIELEDPDLVAEFARSWDQAFAPGADAVFADLTACYSAEIEEQVIELTIDGILASEVLGYASIGRDGRLTGHRAIAAVRLRRSNPEAFAKRFIDCALDAPGIRRSLVPEFHRQAFTNDQFLLGQMARIAAAQTSSPEEAMAAGFVPLCRTLIRAEAEEQFRVLYSHSVAL